MSRRRKLRRPRSRDQVAGDLRALIGHALPGGCPDCTATAELTEPIPGVFVAEIAHDDTCPTWARMQKKGTTR